MRRGILPVLAIVSAIAGSADVQAKPTISTDVVANVNFTAYKTYSWVSTSPPPGVNPVMYQRIVADFESALGGLGYQKAETGELSLVLTIGAQQKTDVESWGRFGLQTSVYQYTQGQLSLDVFDTSTKRALWHGQLSDTVNPDKPNPGKIDAGIAKLMQKFPATSAVGADDASTP